VLISVSDLVVLEGEVLWKHPEAGADHPNVLDSICQQRKFSFFCHKSYSFGPNHVAPAVGRFFVGFVGHGYLQFEVFFADIDERSFAMCANRRDPTRYNFRYGVWWESMCGLCIFLYKRGDGDGGFQGVVNLL
jgi:hypothetical protein